MKALIALAGGLAVVGWAAAAAATMLLGGYFGLAEFEGQRSMTAVFGAGPLGGLLGLVIGLWIALGFRRR